MEKIDDGLKALLESGKEKGYLTYGQVNDHLPDDDANPEKIDQLLILLEDQGIELIDESEVDEREQEIALAKKIEVTRKRFRRKVLECDGALNQVVETLKRVHSGDLPFDRTVKVSLTENLEKDKIMARMPHNLRTLEHLLEQ